MDWAELLKTYGLAGAVGSIATLVITQFIARAARRRKLRAAWESLGAELEACRDRAAIYRNPLNPFAPLYRLPLTVYPISFPVLLAEGAIAKDDVRVLTDCFSLVADINRGLDAIAAHLAKGNTEQAVQESQRLRGFKVEELISGRDGMPARYEQARSVIEREAAKYVP